MSIIQITAFGCMAAALCIVVRNQKPELAMQIGLAAGAVILVALFSQITGILSSIKELANRYSIDFDFFSVAVKVIGIAYIAEFGVQVCKDANENAIASKIELGGKVLMAAIATPVMVSLIDTVVKLLPA
ncbi:MAG: stage III sporulation protein AD [Christensenellales bacterium]